MDKHKDGGPAFPAMTISESVGFAGMTMRQYYKGQALIGLLSNQRDAAVIAARTAAKCADAMIEEDEVHGGR